MKLALLIGSLATCSCVHMYTPIESRCTNAGLEIQSLDLAEDSQGNEHGETHCIKPKDLVIKTNITTP